LRRKKALDALAYRHIRERGTFADRIVEFKTILTDDDFYKWINEIRDLL
jgi:hypothetical protein